MDLTDQEAARAAIQAASGAFEMFSVTSFRGSRIHVDGSEKELTVEVIDAGPTDPNRYTVVASDDDGRAASGDSAADLDVALAGVHWWELDEDDPLSG